MSNAKEKTEKICSVKSKKIIIDFCQLDAANISISVSDDGCNNDCDDHDISLSLNKKMALELADYLENPTNPKVVILNNDQCERRHVWRSLKVMDDDQFVGYILVCSDADGVQLGLQKHNNTKVLASVLLTDADVRVLIGLLYFWVSNQFLSLRLIRSMLKDTLLCVDNIDIKNICYQRLDGFLGKSKLVGA
jgi:hypothetical protein